ncbi:DUF2071 domain-containing protein [Streptomyces malaysiense]|uniref:DUF2071 domain-containing protein n=1 Tax=Streptomyces malaysiense TaxID=1428626 RepID=A0A1J4Q7R7_9ACTN|nr:DUF2071 domain-containing protein [Streptomyces malaysiense]OIK29245.1 hypothetical protein VT52_001970 [Streptomyces malaysiense]
MGLVFFRMENLAFGRSPPLPYQWSRISTWWFDNRLLYTTARRGGVRTGARAWIEVEDTPAPQGPLEEFLTRRWGLHERILGRTYYLPDAHPAWTFRTCTLLGWDDGLIPAAGLPKPAGDPVSVLYAPGLPVCFGPPMRLAASGRPFA